MKRSTITYALLFALACGTAAAAGQGALQSWYFQGTAFREGSVAGLPAVHLADGYLPAITLDDESPDAARLPRGTGGMVVFCYVQNIGGKLSDHDGFLPVAGAAVELRRGAWRMAGRTDSLGYLVLAVPAGTYEITVRGQRREARIEVGRSALVAVRTGKRMVD